MPTITKTEAHKRLREAIDAAKKSETLVEKAELVPVLEGLDRELDSAPVLAVVGEFSSGKSTLLNLLLGEDILPTSPLPTTARPTLIQYGTRRALVLTRRSGSKEACAIEELAKYSDAHAGVDGDSMGIADVEMLEAYLPLESLKSLRFLDTPGLNDPSRPNGSMSLDALTKADAVVWCTRADMPWRATEGQAWKSVPADIKRSAVLVVTNVDALNGPAEVERVRARLTRECGSEFAAIVFVDMRLALRSRTGGRHPSAEGWRESGFASVAAAIGTQVLGRADSLVATRIMRAACERLEAEADGWVQLCDEVNSEAVALDTACRDVGGAWARARTAVERTTEKLAQFFDSRIDWVMKKVQALKTSEEWNEPEEYTETGILFDDQKVKWHTHAYESLDFDRIASVNDELWNSISKQDETSDEALISAMSALRDACAASLEEVKPDDLCSSVCSFLEAASVIVQTASEAPVAELDGSVRGGGLYFIYAIQHANRERLPRGKELRELVSGSIALQGASERLREAATRRLSYVGGQVDRYLDDAWAWFSDVWEKHTRLELELHSIRVRVDPGAKRPHRVQPSRTAPPLS